MQSDVKIGRMELVAKIRDIIGNHCNDPADEMITLGKAMSEIGRALKGQSPAEARTILEAVKVLELG
jgi:hypothetical protein